MSSQQVVMRKSEDALSGMQSKRIAALGKWDAGKAVMTQHR